VSGPAIAGLGRAPTPEPNSARRVVRDLDDLISLCREGKTSFYIRLAGGLARSSKTIQWIEPGGRYRTGKFDVWNEIDDTWQVLWPKQLWTRSHIGEALDLGALWSYGV
jgi:hypothetical protein